MAVIGLLYSIIDTFISNLLSLIGLKPQLLESQCNMHYVNVKYGTQNNTFVLSLTPDMTVEDIKRQMVSKIGVRMWSEIAIIFSGRELPNDFKLNDSDLGQNSVIHAVRVKHNNNAKDVITFTPFSLNERLANVNIDDTARSNNNTSALEGSAREAQTKSYFYGYCSSLRCKRVVSAKLRVNCDKCRNGTIVVDSDPTQWDDVLIRGRISGVCQSEECDGTVANFYFKCASNTHRDDNIGDDSQCVPLYLIRHNSIAIACLACTDVKDPILVFPCNSGHVICLDCFKDYCLSKLNERKFIIDTEVGYSLGCAVRCPDSLIKETHHFRIMGDEAYQKYQTFAAEECVLKAGGVLCPQPKCGAGILIDAPHSDVECTRVLCANCGFVFCRKCLQGYHVDNCLFDGIADSCDASTSAYKTVDANTASTSKWNEQMSRSAIRELTKPCPKCRTPTERDGGCMHMVCSRSQCGFNWCWVCQTEWSRDCMGNHWFG